MKRLVIIVLAVMVVGLVGCSSLSRAISKGNVAEVERLISAGANVNTGPSFDPLNQATYENAPIEVVRLLLENGANVNSLGSGGAVFAAAPGSCGAPLHYAVFNNNAKMLKLLLDHGADTGISSCTDRKETPLQLARTIGANTEIINLLRTAEARQNGQTDLTKTASPTEPPAGETKIVARTPVRSDVDQFPAAASPTNKNAYAVVIGIEKYRQGLPEANFATADAQLVTTYLTKVLGYPEENVVTLLNDRALQSDLTKYFEKWLPNNVEAYGTVFVYYSGHGAPNPKTGDAYLVPYDGDPAFIDETGYSLKRMYAALGKLPAKSIVVALDSCFSGAGGRSVIAKGTRSISLNLKEQTPLARNMTVLAASSGEQTSSTYDEKGHGLFTYFFLKGIKNEDVVAPDGSLRLADLFAYLQPQVERVARKQFNNEQTPQLIGAEKRN